MRFAGTVALVFIASLVGPTLGRTSRLVTRGVDAPAALPTAVSNVVHCPSLTIACARHRRHDDDGDSSPSATFECIDPDSDFRSCGGCRDPTKGHEKGEDCTEIEGASEAYCDCGACVVRSCRPGYVLDNSGAFCAWHGISEDMNGGKFRDNGKAGGWWFLL